VLILKIRSNRITEDRPCGKRAKIEEVAGRRARVTGESGSSRRIAGSTAVLDI